MAGRRNERTQYFRGLRLIVDSGKEKQNESEKLLPDATSKNFRKYYNDMIWLEIKAKICGHSLIEQDRWLVQTRQKTVTKLCDEILNFTFKPLSVSTVKQPCVNCDCFLRNCVIRLSGEYLKNLFAGMKQVRDLQENIKQVEDLYSSIRGLICDHPELENSATQEKLQILSCWLNSTSELMFVLMSVVNWIGTEEHKEHLSGFMYDVEVLNPVKDLFKDYVPLAAYPSISDLTFSCCELTESILSMTEVQFHKRSVQSIHLQMLKNYFGCLTRSRDAICFDNRHQLKKKQPNGNDNWNAILNSLCSLDFLIQCVVDLKTGKSIEQIIPKNQLELPCTSTDFFSLPELEPLHVFLCSIMFAIMGECLQARLQQALSCRDKCSASTSLLTVQQFVAECKEVIECSMLALSVHLYLMHSVDDKNALESFEKTAITPFRNDLMQLFCTYMDFVKLLVIGQLNGLPNAPYFFIDILHKEWNFAKQIARKIGLGDVCTKKYIDICTEVFVSTQHFLNSAINAILTSKTKPETLLEEVESSESKRVSRCKSIDQTQIPVSPSAGVLWFHRQRSESPHLAHRHSLLDDSGSLDDFLMMQSSFFEGCDWEPVESTRRYLFELGRAIRDMFQEVRERFTRAGHYANVLKKDLEYSVAFQFTKDFSDHKKVTKAKTCFGCSFFSKLANCGAVRVSLDHDIEQLNEHKWLLSVFKMSDYHLFVYNKEGFAASKNLHHSVLNFLLATCINDSFCSNIVGDLPEVLLVVHRWDFLQSNIATEKPQKKKATPHVCVWNGEEIHLDKRSFNNFQFDCLTPIDKEVVFAHDVTMVCSNGLLLSEKRKEFMKLLSKHVKVELYQMNILPHLKGYFLQMYKSILSFCEALINQIYDMTKHLQKQIENEVHSLGSETEALILEINRITQRVFNIGFECLQTSSSLLVGSTHSEMDQLQASFVQKWMKYVLEHLPQGKGKKPRWAGKGLKFLVSLDPNYLNGLSNEKFKELKDLINKFFAHLIGTRPRQETVVQNVAPSIDKKVIYRSLSSHSSSDGDELHGDQAAFSFGSCNKCSSSFMKNIRLKVMELDQRTEDDRYENCVIGRVMDADEHTPTVPHQVRSASFRWQRGKKIGEGGFGKVYTCVNIDTGKILAMKEIHFQAYDEGKIQEIMDEMNNFEGISHPNLVRFFGIELHQNLMFIFMEYCDSGTLADISEIGLPEVMIQQYTMQIVTGVHVLHQKGIVHRDIKGSNIFLMSTGLLKLGDFGSAVRLKDPNKTAPGEILSRTGITTAYTAPEVINCSTGYGRAADIWSVGCVIIEMATGKRPWHDHEQFQIMYKVGMGSQPPIPQTLSEDGQSFVGHCLEVDTSLRWTSTGLLSHQFVKVAHPFRE